MVKLFDISCNFFNLKQKHKIINWYKKQMKKVKMYKQN